jgi:hypothetical protein
MPDPNPTPATTNEASLTALVTGIVHDAEELFKQQMALFKTEMRQDYVRTKEAAISLGTGLGVAALGAIFLCFFVVYLLNWGLAIPLWGCYLIVGGVLCTAGVVLFFWGRSQFESFNPLPDQSVRAVKENVQWMRNPK